jgi:hypothetical protein
MPLFQAGRQQRLQSVGILDVGVESDRPDICNMRDRHPVVNAWPCGANGTISVHVIADGNEAVLKVKDSGNGIAPEILPLVFELFTQAAKSLDSSQDELAKCSTGILSKRSIAASCAARVPSIRWLNCTALAGLWADCVLRVCSTATCGAGLNRLNIAHMLRDYRRKMRATTDIRLNEAKVCKTACKRRCSIRIAARTNITANTRAKESTSRRPRNL